MGSPNPEGSTSNHFNDRIIVQYPPISGNVTDRLVVIIQPLGREVDVLDAPLNAYMPDITVVITNLAESVDNAKEHLENKWRRIRTTLIPKLIGEPWRAETIEEYMGAFNESVEEIRREHPGRDIEWHVGTAGGTNLMGIASGMCAFTYSFPAYYSNKPGHYPQLAESPEELIVEIKILKNTGPAHKCMQSDSCKRTLLAIYEKKLQTGLGFLTQKDIAAELGNSAASMTSPMKRLVNTKLVEKKDGRFEVTILGKMMLSYYSLIEL